MLYTSQWFTVFLLATGWSTINSSASPLPNWLIGWFNANRQIIWNIYLKFYIFFFSFFSGRVTHTRRFVFTIHNSAHVLPSSFLSLSLSLGLSSFWFLIHHDRAALFVVCGLLFACLSSLFSSHRTEHTHVRCIGRLLCYSSILLIHVHISKFISILWTRLRSGKLCQWHTQTHTYKQNDYDMDVELDAYLVDICIRMRTGRMGGMCRHFGMATAHTVCSWIHSFSR